MRLVLGHDREVAAFVASLLTHIGSGDFGTCAAIGVEHGGVLLGGVVYNEYRPSYGSIEMHFAARDPRWLIGPPGDRRAIVQVLLGYPFVQLGVQRVTGITPKRCRAARAVVEKLGFKREGLVRRGFGNDDAVISGLLRKEWAASPWATA